MTSSQPPKKNPAEEQATPSNGAQTAKAKQANASQAQASQNAAPQAQVNNAASLRKALNQCMMRDRFRLSKRISGANKIKKDWGWEPQWAGINDLVQSAWNWHQRLYG